MTAYACVTALDRLTAMYPEHLMPIDLDVSNDESVYAFGAAVAGVTDRLELVINNAGIAIDLEHNLYSGLNTESEFNVDWN
jgi:NAD(P)-dependent dehydrogenase (short-subunit alcohol dehydrogenase family)